MNKHLMMMIFALGCVSLSAQDFEQDGQETQQEVALVDGDVDGNAQVAESADNE